MDSDCKYFIIKDDGSSSAGYTFTELERMKVNSTITRDTYILKEGDTDAKLASALFDFTDQVKPLYGNRFNNKETNIPDEVKGLNWGAFFLVPLWSIFHNTYIGLLWFAAPLIATLCIKSWGIQLFGSISSFLWFVVAPLLGFITISLILLLRGNEFAWKNREFTDINDFKETQKKWKEWGAMCFFILGSVLFVCYCACVVSANY